MTSTSAAYIKHASPGRTRIALPQHRNDPSALGAIAARLRASPDVIAVDIAELTGSLLIRHEMDPEKVLKTARDLGLFNLGDDPRAARHRQTLRSEIGVEAALFGIVAGLSLLQLYLAPNWFAAATLALSSTGVAISRDMESHARKLRHRPPVPVKEPGSAAAAVPVTPT